MSFGRDESTTLEAFEHHNPSPGQIQRIQRVRAAAKAFVRELFAACPESADRTVALRMAHEAMMTANKSIVLE